MRTRDISRVVLRIENATTRVALAGAVLALFVAAAAGFYQVWTRFVFQDSSAWTEVVTRTALIWMIFLGAAPSIRMGHIISIDLIYQVPSASFKRLLSALALLAMTAVFGVLLIYG